MNSKFSPVSEIWGNKGIKLTPLKKPFVSVSFKATRRKLGEVAQFENSGDGVIENGERKCNEQFVTQSFPQIFRKNSLFFNFA